MGSEMCIRDSRKLVVSRKEVEWFCGAVVCGIYFTSSRKRFISKRVEVSEMPGHRNVRKICFARSSIMELPETRLWCADAKYELSRAVVLCVAEWSR